MQMGIERIGAVEAFEIARNIFKLDYKTKNRAKKLLTDLISNAEHQVFNDNIEELNEKMLNVLYTAV